MFDSDHWGKEMASLNFSVRGQGGFRLTKVDFPVTIVSDSRLHEGWIYYDGNPEFPITVSYTGTVSGSARYNNFDDSVDLDNRRLRLSPWCTEASRIVENKVDITLTDATGDESTITGGWMCLPASK